MDCISIGTIDVLRDQQNCNPSHLTMLPDFLHGLATSCSEMCPGALRRQGIFVSTLLHGWVFHIDDENAFKGKGTVQGPKVSCALSIFQSQQVAAFNLRAAFRIV